MRIIMQIQKKWIGKKPDCAGNVYLLECSQSEMFEQIYPLIGQPALHATSGNDVDIRLYFICEDGRRLLPVDRPSLMSGAFNGGVSPLEPCELKTSGRIEELVKANELLPSINASDYLLRGVTK